MKTKTIGIVGYGSIGRRYASILKNLNCNIIVYRTGNANPDTPGFDLTLNYVFDLSQFFNYQLDACFICNPSHLHLEFIKLCANKHIPFLVEKPISHEFKIITSFLSSDFNPSLKTSTGYMMRYDKGLSYVKKLLKDNSIGKPIYCHSTWSTYLPSWHPWEDYSKSYAANNDMGGGVTLTCSHEIDTLRYLFGEISISTANGFSSEYLNTNVDDCIDITARSMTNLEISLHIDWFSKEPKRFLEITTNKGILKWDFFMNEVTFSGDFSLNYSYEQDVNYLYEELVINFLHSLDNKMETLSNIHDALETQKLCYEIKKRI